MSKNLKTVSHHFVRRWVKKPSSKGKVMTDKGTGNKFCINESYNIIRFKDNRKIQIASDSKAIS